MKEKSVLKSDEGRKAILSVYETLLERWPVPYEGLVLNTSRGDTFAIACGDISLPPLVLIHGSSSNSAMWIGEVITYSRHYRVYAVDIPGEPGKSADKRIDVNSQGYADWLRDIFSALKIEKAVIIGMSLGGWAALKFAVSFPEKVDKLVLLCPAGIAPQKVSFIFYAVFMAFLGKRGFEKTIRKVYGSDDIPDEAFRYSRLIADNFNPYVGTIPVFADDELGRLAMPVMMLLGERDALINSRKTAGRSARLLPHAHITILDGAGHALINMQDRVIAYLLSKE